MAELLRILEAEASLKSGIMEHILSQGFKDNVSVSTTNSNSNSNSNITSRNANLNANKTNNSKSISTTTNGNMNDNCNDNSRIDNALITNGNMNTTTTSTTGTTTNNINNSNRMKPTGASNITNMNENENDSFFYVDPKSNSLSDVRSVLAKVKAPCKDHFRLLVDQVTGTATEAHMTTTNNTHAQIKAAHARIAQQTTKPKMPDMSKANPEALMQRMLNAMVPSMTRVVQFAKKLPGFSDLPTPDQVTLIKTGLFEVMVTRITLLIDPTSDTMLDPGLKMKSSRATVRAMPPMGPFMDQMFDVAGLTQPLELTDGETGLFTAVLMMCPDRRGLTRGAEVRALQQLYLTALHTLMRHNHSDADDKFCALLDTITAIRKINDDHFRFLHGVKSKSGPKFESLFPQLHRELFDTSLH